MREPFAESMLASAGVLVRDDGQMLLVRHAAGPFAGRWSMPLVGVAASETAEEALARLLRDVLRVQPGPVEFLDTIAVEVDGTHLVLNAFACVAWEGELALAAGPYDEAVWAPPAEAPTLDLVPEVRDWIASSVAASGGPAPRMFDVASVEGTLADARGDLIAAYDALPVATRRATGVDGTCPLDVLALAADAEIYAVHEAMRCLAEPGRRWRAFNDAQWADTRWDDGRRVRPADDETTVRARLQEARGAMHAWLTSTGGDALDAWVESDAYGTIQLGMCILELAQQDRSRATALASMTTH